MAKATRRPDAESENPAPNTTHAAVKGKGGHSATYATDKRKGGYLVRVHGPNPTAFVGKEVPVTKRNGDQSFETLERVVWSGTDQENGGLVALYTFKAKPRDPDAEIEF